MKSDDSTRNVVGSSFAGMSEVPIRTDCDDWTATGVYWSKSTSDRNNSSTIDWFFFALKRGIGTGTSRSVVVSFPVCVMLKVSCCGLTSPVPPVSADALAIPYIVTFQKFKWVGSN